MRDHLLGWPGVLALIDPDQKPSRRTPERVRVVPTFLADCRTCDSDKPPREDKPAESEKPATNIEPGCFGVWRKTPPQPNVELTFRSPWTGEIKSRWPGPQSGWADGWEWFDTSAEPEKPAQAEPQADAGWIEHDGKGMPVDGTTLIEVRLRRGTTHKDHAALWHDEDPKYSNWVHEPCQLDIVAYRVVSA